MPTTPALANLKSIGAQLIAAGFRVATVEPDPPHVLAYGLNVWEAPYDRYPWTTVWCPRLDIPNDTWSWGSNFEFSLPGDAPRDAVVAAVINSLPKSTIVDAAPR